MSPRRKRKLADNSPTRPAKRAAVDRTKSSGRQAAEHPRDARGQRQGRSKGPELAEASGEPERLLRQKRRQEKRETSRGGGKAKHQAAPAGEAAAAAAAAGMADRQPPSGGGGGGPSAGQQVCMGHSQLWSCVLKCGEGLQWAQSQTLASALLCRRAGDRTVAAPAAATTSAGVWVLGVCVGTGSSPGCSVAVPLRSPAAATHIIPSVCLRWLSSLPVSNALRYHWRVAIPCR